MMKRLGVLLSVTLLKENFNSLFNLMAYTLYLIWALSLIVIVLEKGFPFGRGLTGLWLILIGFLRIPILRSYILKKIFSDHAPLLFQVKHSIKHGTVPFKFHRMWTQHVGLLPLV